MADKDTYIITGATGGLGQAILAVLATRPGIRIVLAVRNVDRAREIAKPYLAQGCDIQCIRLDLASLRSTREAANEILTRNWSVKALINNAGIMPAKIQITEDGNEMATQVNYSATRLFTELLLPAIPDGSAIIFTTSVTRRLGKPDAGWIERAKTHRCLGRRFYTYGMSKRLITDYALDLSQSLLPRQIRVNCNDPGVSDTGMISMGNKAIDRLADIFFRPVINTAAQGAAGAIAALDSTLTGHIFTKSKHFPIKK